MMDAPIYVLDVQELFVKLKEKMKSDPEFREIIRGMVLTVLMNDTTVTIRPNSNIGSNEKT